MSYTEKIQRQQEEERSLDSSGRREAEPIPVEGIVSNADQVVVRKTPDKGSNNIVGVVPKGTKLRILGREGAFYRVQIQDRFDDPPVYIFERFCQVRR